MDEFGRLVLMCTASARGKNVTAIAERLAVPNRFKVPKRASTAEFACPYAKHQERDCEDHPHGQDYRLQKTSQIQEENKQKNPNRAERELLGECEQ